MKLSRYNSYISLGEAGLIFNSFTDSFVAVKSSSDGFAKVRNGDITSISSELQKQLEGPVRLWRTILMKSTLSENVLTKSTTTTLSCFCTSIRRSTATSVAGIATGNHIKGSCMTPETYGNVVKARKNRIAKATESQISATLFLRGEPLLRFDEVVKPLISEIAALCKDAGIDISVHFTSTHIFLQTR